LENLTTKKEWKLTKTVLPQHTDHAGVLWHGSYFNFLEESRIDALKKVGISYSELSNKGYEIPVISAKIKYKRSFINGEKVVLRSQFELVNRILINCKTLLLKETGDIGAEALIKLVFIRKKNDSLKIVRQLPAEINKMLLLLEKGPKN